MTNQSNSTQDTEDVVTRLRTRVSNALADKVIGSLSKLEGYAPPETEQDWACVDAAQTIRALCQLLDEPADRQSLSDRIDVLEEGLNAIIDGAGRRDVKWSGMNAHDIARAALHQEATAP